MKSLKIAIITDDGLDRPDGVQQHIKIFSKWLVSKGHQVRFLSGQTKIKNISGQKIYSMSKNFKINANQNTLTLPMPVKQQKISSIFDRENFDVVHVMLPCSPLMGAKATKEAIKRGIPVIGTFHTYPGKNIQIIASWLYGLYTKRLYSQYHQIISVSVPTQKYVKRCFFIDSLVIPNFINLAKFDTSFANPKYRKSKFNIIFINRLVKRKGSQHLVEALGLIKKLKLLENWHAYICGFGPLDQKLKIRVAQLGMNELVTFTGFIKEEDKPVYLASADLAIYPATGGEAFGIVLLEAMASGTLVLGGNNPGYASVLHEKINHLVVNPKDYQKFANQIVTLLTNKTLRSELLKWQTEAIKHYDVDVVGKQIETVYFQAVGE